MTLLFIHGAGCTGEVFDAQVRAFPGSHAPNLPGHVCAGAPETIEQFADAIEQYVHENQLSAVLPCGHSMGGAVVLELALRNPAWLTGAVLLGSGARMRVAPAILDGLRDDFEPAAHSIAGYFFAEPSAQRIEGAVQSMRRVGQAQTIRDFRACDAFNALDRLGSLTVPLLALTGEEDKMMPPKFALALADRVPGAQARIVSGAGHFVMVERPAETNEAISAFLAGLS